MDDDLNSLALESLVQEILKLRNGIRYHMAQREHSRCWLDDVKLYSLLPEGNSVDFTLPCKKEFLSECEKFWENRQPIINLEDY